MQYNFTKFLDLVENGTKPHTIRRAGKRRPPRVGELLQIYTGLRTPHAHKLIEDVPCLGVQPIQIVKADGIYLDHRKLNAKETRRLIWNDGFRLTKTEPDEVAFWRFFYDRPPVGDAFDGYLISWWSHEFLPAVKS